MITMIITLGLLVILWVIVSIHLHGVAMELKAETQNRKFHEKAAEASARRAQENTQRVRLELDKALADNRILRLKVDDLKKAIAKTAKNDYRDANGRFAKAPTVRAKR